MRMLACCFVASALWCALAWCAVCASTSPDSSDVSALALDLTASFAFIGVAAISAGVWAAQFASED